MDNPVGNPTLIPNQTTLSPGNFFYSGGGGGGGVTSVNSITGAVTISAGSNITLSNPTANTIEITASGGGGGGITPVQTRPTLVNFPLTCPAGSSTPVCNTLTFTAGHTYTASISLAYRNTGEGVTTGDAIALSFNTPSSPYGTIVSPPAYLTGANTSDGALQLFTATWTQGTTLGKCGLYIIPSGTGYDTILTQIDSAIDGILTITDWGAL